MTTKLQGTLRLDQRMSMSQHLRQAINLLQYNTLDLKLFVKQCIETNPLLEIEESEENPSEQSSDDEENQYLSNQFSADYSRSSHASEEENVLENYSAPKSLREHLIDQALACGLTDTDYLVAESIIDAIDDNGYLRSSLDEVKQISHAEQSMERFAEILKVVQSFDPVGVGARDMRECLLLQLEQMPDKAHAWQTAYDIVKDYFIFFSTNDRKKILRELHLSLEEYTQAIQIIRQLNLYPGASFTIDNTNNIEPELYVRKIKNQWHVFLSQGILTNVKINTQYQDLIKQNKKHGSYPALRRELDEAKALLKGLKRRNETLMAVAERIVEAQKEFLDYGHEFMKPMNIADVSNALGLHESTVSRITTGKHIITPKGVYELKYFFPSHVRTQSGETCSATAVKAHIKEFISQENDGHALSDGEIAELLREKGINIARRTVAKYRESMNILPSYQRQKVLGPA